MIKNIFEQIWKSRSTILQYLDANGYDVDPYKNTSIHIIREMCTNPHANLLNMMLHKKDKPPEGAENDENPEVQKDPVANPFARVFVHYHYHEKTSSTSKSLPSFKSTTLYDIIDSYKIKYDMQTVDNLTIIISNQNDIPDTMYKLLSQIWENDGVFVNLFSLKELQFSILEHILVPKHVVLSERDKIRVYEQFYVKSDRDLPEISRFDPAAKANALRPKQVCQIFRPNQNSIEDSNYYRICT